MISRRSLLKLDAVTPALIATATVQSGDAHADSDVFTDQFRNLNNWTEINTPRGLYSRIPPEIAQDIGGLQGPCLKLTENDPATYQPGTAIQLNDFECTDGVIQLDAYLAECGFLDIFFRADFQAEQSYFGRFEGRTLTPFPDAFLDAEPWSFLGAANTQTAPGTWNWIKIVARG